MIQAFEDPIIQLPPGCKPTEFDFEAFFQSQRNPADGLPDFGSDKIGFMIRLQEITDLCVKINGTLFQEGAIPDQTMIHLAKLPIGRAKELLTELTQNARQVSEPNAYLFSLMANEFAGHHGLGEEVFRPSSDPAHQSGTHYFNYGDDCQYSGQFQGGMRHGFGLLTSPKGRYLGEFRNNRLHGFAECSNNAGGRVYMGYFANNQRHGVGGCPSRSPGGTTEYCIFDQGIMRKALSKEQFEAALSGPCLQHEELKGQLQTFINLHKSAPAQQKRDVQAEEAEQDNGTRDFVTKLEFEKQRLVATKDPNEMRKAIVYKDALDSLRKHMENIQKLEELEKAAIQSDDIRKATTCREHIEIERSAIQSTKGQFHYQDGVAHSKR